MNRTLNRFARLFPTKAIIGMIHLQALPGAPAYEGNFQHVLDTALADAATLEQGGVDALMIENFFDAPFFKDQVGPETVAAMTRAITLIRQQARYALADIQDACRLARRPVPEVKLPDEQPLDGLYAPDPLVWSEPRLADVPRDVEAPPAKGAELSKYLARCLDAKNFHNLNNAQAAGAARVMTARVEETRLAFAALAKVPGEEGRKPLLDALNDPAPYVRYLAAAHLAERGEREAVPALLKRLDVAAKTQDTVGFWWCCEALGRLRAKEAIPVLAKHATATNPPGTYGPEGMAFGYVAAAALARIAADPKQADVARLLTSENSWLKAGVLRGLAEADAAGVEALLEEASKEENPAVVREEARVQLQRRRARSD